MTRVKFRKGKHIGRENIEIMTSEEVEHKDLRYKGRDTQTIQGKQNTEWREQGADHNQKNRQKGMSRY